MVGFRQVAVGVYIWQAREACAWLGRSQHLAVVQTDEVCPRYNTRKDAQDGEVCII